MPQKGDAGPPLPTDVSGITAALKGPAQGTLPDPDRALACLNALFAWQPSQMPQVRLECCRCPVQILLRTMRT
jgi:hypothetical protein